jgi:hypothetical protein
MPFVKGQSGNPAGRRKKTSAEREVEELARDHGPDAIARLRHWMDSDDARASAYAANSLLDRAYGKPKQRNEHTGEGGGPLAVTWLPPQ